MPIYTFKHKETGEEVTKFIGFAERDAWLEANPDWFQPPTLPQIGDPIRLGITKTSDGFQEILKNAKRNHKDHTINTRS